MRLAGKIAIVTGAGGDIGSAVALRFAREGARVVVSDSAADESADIARAIVAAGGAAIAIAADVTSAQDLRQLVLETQKAFGPPTVLCNNASGNFDEPRLLADISENAFRATLDMNLKGAWMTMKHIAPAMIEAGGGSIVTIGSVGAFIGYATAGYIASNAAIVALTRNAGVELAKHDIRVNVVCAGEIASSDADPEMAKRTSALQRAARPEEIANMALYLASDEASYCTASPFVVDGGWMAIRPLMSVR